MLSPTGRVLVPCLLCSVAPYLEKAENLSRAFFFLGSDIAACQDEPTGLSAVTSSTSGHRAKPARKAALKAVVAALFHGCLVAVQPTPARGGRRLAVHVLARRGDCNHQVRLIQLHAYYTAVGH